MLVQHVDEIHEILRRAVARGRREVAGRLVAPRAVERMLGDRHQLDVREALLAARSRRAARRFRDNVGSRLPLAAPRAEMHLVDRDRRVERVAGAARRHPRVVAPIVVERPRARGRRRRRLGEQCERVGLVQFARPSRRDDADTCRRRRARRRRRCLPRCPMHPGAVRADGRRRPSRSTRRSPQRAPRSAPRRGTWPRRGRAGSPASSTGGRACLPERGRRPGRPAWVRASIDRVETAAAKARFAALVQCYAVGRAVGSWDGGVFDRPRPGIGSPRIGTVTLAIGGN